MCNESRACQHWASAGPHRVLTIAPSSRSSQEDLFLQPWRFRILKLRTCTLPKREQRVCASLNDDHRGTTHLLERKEKKKKKSKVADASVHAETQPEMVKGGRTKKEVVDSGSLVEPEPAPSNLEGKEKKKKRKRDREDEGPPSSDKNEKKKRKKEKTSGTASDPTSAAPLEAADISGFTTLATSEVKEMKKRRKAKSSAETFNPPTSDIEPTPIAGAVDGARKPRKRKTAKDDTTDANGGGEPLSHSKPKSKKRKKGEDEDHPSTVTPTEDSPQKRKKSKTSIHPDPSNDSDLTEQSRKGSQPIPIQSLTLQIPNN